MNNSDWIAYKIKVRDRLKNFALKILELSEMLPKNTRTNVINYQICKSGSSSYANYRASLRGRSKAEFFSKLSIAVEEIDETEMWLDLLIDAKIINNDFVKMLDALKINGKKTLLLTSDNQENVYKSGRNIDKVSVLEAQKVSTYDLLNNQVLLLQKSAIEKLVSVFN